MVEISIKVRIHKTMDVYEDVIVDITQEELDTVALNKVIEEYGGNGENLGIVRTYISHG